MNARTSSKAALLGESPSFAAAATRVHSDRGRLIEGMAAAAEDSAAPPRSALLADLALNPKNPRTTLREIQEMADSLLENGQLQVATVITRAAFLAKYPGLEEKLDEDQAAARWVVLDGNRRLAGARQAGLDELRIDVRDELAEDLLTNAFVANIQHESFSPLEEALALADLVEEHGSLRAVARKISKTHVWISQRLALLQLIPELQAAVESGDLYVEDARQIGRLPQDEQAAAAGRAAAARQENKARRAAGRRAATAGSSGDDSRSGGGGAGAQATPPPDPAPPSEKDSVNGGSPAAAGGGSGPAGPAGQAAEGDTTPPAGAGGAAAGSSPARSAHPPARPGRGSGPTGAVGPAGPPAEGNGVPAPPAGAGVINWADVPSLAALIRQQLTASQLRDLLGLLTGDS